MKSSLTRFQLILVFWAFAINASALKMSDHWSPLNKDLPVRDSTKLIILHMTEGPTKGSLSYVMQYGLCNYLITPAGYVCRIVDSTRVAHHAGCSMWDGEAVPYKGNPSVSPFSIGIEIVGYHDKLPTKEQIDAVRELLAMLQGAFGVDDDHVLTHSMVAYGKADKDHAQDYRGRRRCAMLLAGDKVRAELGLDPLPKVDPDLQAGRVIVCDKYLCKCIYGCDNPVGTIPPKPKVVEEPVETVSMPRRRVFLVVPEPVSASPALVGSRRKRVNL